MNVNKIKVLGITKLRSKISFQYIYDDTHVQKVEEQRDLGVIFDSNFNFNKHIEVLSTKAFMTLGFVKKFGKNYFSKCKTIRSQLEYASQIWTPYQLKYIEKIEMVQRKCGLSIFKETQLHLDNMCPIMID